MLELLVIKGCKMEPNYFDCQIEHFALLPKGSYLHVNSVSLRQSSKHSRLEATDTVRLTSVLSL